MKLKDLHELSESDLANLVEDAQKELKEREDGKRKQVITEIKALAASIGIAVELQDVDAPKTRSRRGSKVPIKYRNRANHSETWTGRGVKPKWLRTLLDQGRSLDEFLV